MCLMILMFSMTQKIQYASVIHYNVLSDPKSIVCKWHSLQEDLQSQNLTHLRYKETKWKVCLVSHISTSFQIIYKYVIKKKKGVLSKNAENHLTQWFSRCFPGPTASASTGNLLEMQIIKSYFRPTKQETLGEGPSNLCFHELCRCFRTADQMRLFSQSLGPFLLNPCQLAGQPYA